jgi:multicomponent Na+:H+ antiporter subunit E
MRSVLRAGGFLVVWIALIGWNPLDLAVGMLTAAVATWLSLFLLPPRPRASRVGLLALLRLAGHFLRQSVVAGLDVARRAFDPRMPLQPGFVSYPLSFRPGPARNIFASWTSLLPGTVPVADDGETLLYHCLDVGQPIAKQLGTEEAWLAPLLEGAHRDV